MIGAFDVQVIAEASAVRIVDCLLGGTLIGFFAAAVLKLSPRQRSGMRFAVWFSALLAIAALPFLTAAMHSQHAAFPPPTPMHSLLALPGRWAIYIFVAWTVIAGAGLARLGISLWQMRALRRSCVAVTAENIPPRLRATLARDGGMRCVALCTSDRVQVPTAMGLVAPAVVIPQWLMWELEPEELNLIVLHEVAHLRRWDDWTNLAQEIIRAVFFFHPAVWWIEGQLAMEREVACDDAVVAATEAPRAYAECLTRLAEKSLVRRTLALAQAGLGPTRQMFQRLEQILDANHPRRTRGGWKWAIPVVAGLAIASGVVASKEPQLVAFENTHAVAADAFSMASASFYAPAAVPGAFTSSTALRSKKVSAVPTYLVHATGASRTTTATVKSATPLPEPPAEKAFILESVIEQPRVVPATSADAVPAPSVETILFLVQRDSGNSRQPVFEIQWWRLTVLHPVPRPTGGEIPKKT